MSMAIEKIFLQVLNMSIMAGYCILAVLGLRWVFRKAPKRYSYLLWIVVAFRLMCPLTIDSAFSIFNLDLIPEIAAGEQPGSAKGQEELDSAGNTVDRYQDSIPNTGQNGEITGSQPGLINPENPEINGSQSGLTNPENPEINGSQSGLMNSENPEITGNQSGVMNSENPEITGSQSGVMNSENPEINGSQSGTVDRTNISVRWSLVGAYVWIGGVAALAVYMLVSYLRLKWQIRFAVKIKNGVYEAEGIQSAFVLGVINPKIYLPAGLTGEEQSWILLHENCHKWRRDYLVKMIASVLTMVYWFSPLVWVAWNCFCRDMEMSCDEMALEGASQEMRKAYSRTLLSVASDRKVSWHLPPAFGENSVKRRIKHILSFKKPAVWAGGVFAVVLVVMLVVFGTNGRTNTNNDTENGFGETIGAENGDGFVAGNESAAGADSDTHLNSDDSSQGGVISTGSGLNRDYKNVVFQKESLEYDFPLGINDMASDGETVYLYGWQYASSTELEFALARCNLDGSDMKTIYTYEETFDAMDELNRENGERVLCMEVDPDGNLILVMLYRVSRETSYELAKWDRDGNVLWSVEIPEECNGYSSLSCTEEEIIVGGTGYFWTFDQDGNLKKSIVFEKTAEVGMANLHVTQDDQVYVSYYDVGGYDSGPTWEIYPIDLENGTVGEALDVFWLSFANLGNLLTGKVVGYDFDFVTWNDYGIYGWSIGDEVCTEIVNFIDSDIDPSKYFELKKILGTGKLLAVFRDSMQGELGLLTQVDPEQIPERQVITVGGISVESIADQVSQFNRASEKYYVKLLEYSQFGADAWEMLRRDVEVGMAPDIFYRAGNTLINSFISDGLIEDLSTWFEDDSQLNAEDYLTNIFEACGVNGAWYELPMAFQIYTYRADVADVGNRRGWTVEEAKQLFADSSKSRWYGTSQTRIGFLEKVLQFVPFADEMNGTCSFDSEEFIAYLEWANEFPKTEEGWEASMLQEGLLSSVLIRDFAEFRRSINTTDEKTMVGFPGASGNGGYVDALLKLSMSAQSDCKEGAWEFIRSFLSDEYQMTYAGAANGFPVKLSALEAEAAAALKEDYYSSPWAGILTEEELDLCIEYLKSMEYANCLSYDIRAIAVEEASRYFNGELSAEDAAKEIQRRVEAYMAE